MQPTFDTCKPGDILIQLVNTPDDIFKIRLDKKYDDSWSVTIVEYTKRPRGVDVTGNLLFDSFKYYDYSKETIWNQQLKELLSET